MAPQMALSGETNIASSDFAALTVGTSGVVLVNKCL